MSDQLLIYGLKDPRTDEIRYIGKSSKGLLRPESHRKPSKLAMDDTHKARWIKELHALGLMYVVEVLEYVKEHRLLNDAERYWIREARTHGWCLTNLTDGGDGTSVGAKFSAEHRARISAANKGQRWTPEQRERFLQHVRTRDRAVYTALGKALSARNIGTKRSAETRAKIGAAHRGKVVSAEACAKVSRANSKPVRDLDSGVIYPSAKAAGKALGIEPSGVQYAATGRFKKIKGHRFEYLR